MKQVLAFLLLMSTTLSFAINNDTTLMTIGGKNITLGEFEYLHKKNNQVVTEEENSTENYVDLFVNFKLKVIEAEDLGLDTLSSFVTELAGYRDQLAEPYLKDQDLDEKLIQEAYDRLKEEVKASHILIKLEGNNPKDTLAAYNKAMEAREKILKGDSFESVARAYSEDASAATNGGLLGYFTGFQMVLPFEEAAFNTPVGEISMPARSRFGYHVIKVHNRRASKGEVNVSHILILSNDKMSDDEKAEKEKKAFSIYAQIQEGKDFAKLAKEHSDDHGSSTKGGNIGFIRTGQTIPHFEKVAFVE
ncbi:MAG: peptidylprolyl isomerase [Bacteroidales bacterium]|jgi:peptidyl-prolyl cis-trans isomerase SurA|nr:peptidylprolyl isomerase [Bacteroidales bacterium]